MLSGQGHGAPTPADPLLYERLGCAVPAALADLAGLEPDARRERLAAWHTGTAQRIAEQGDLVRHGGLDGASAFIWLSRGLAVLAHAPGGVTAFGAHWCVDHALCVRAAATRPGDGHG